MIGNRENPDGGERVLDRAEGERILRSGFGDQLHQISFRYTVPIAGFGTRFLSGAGDDLVSGSGFFLKVGAQLFGVTADHVYRACDEVSRRGGFTQVGNYPLNLRERLIDRSDSLDIATFRISDVELSMVRPDLVLWEISNDRWPPRPPDVGKGVFLAGFAKPHRKQLGRQRVEWGAYGLVLAATTVTETT